MSKSEKLYKDSPAITKDQDGKPGVTKPTKADGENMGIEGNDIEGAGDGMPVKTQEMHDRHQKEMKDTHKRHEEEIKDMHKRHAKEHTKVMSGSESEGKESPEEKVGK